MRALRADERQWRGTNTVCASHTAAIVVPMMPLLTCSANSLSDAPSRSSGSRLIFARSGPSRSTTILWCLLLWSSASVLATSDPAFVL